MTLRTGNKGFTLVEVIVATAVLSLGAVLIYEAFFISLDSFHYCSDYLKITPWMDEKIWQVQDNLRRFGPSANIITHGNLVKNNSVFDWDLSCAVIGRSEEEDLYKIDLVLYVPRGRNKIRLLRSAYATAAHEEE